MELTLTRTEEINEATIGELTLDKEFICFTLEDKVREPAEPHVNLDKAAWVRSWKIPGKTAIPRGRYEVIINWSNRFGLLLPLLVAVPGFEGVRIHPGNKKEDTEGCILLGLAKQKDTVLLSRKAQGALMRVISKSKDLGTILREQTWLTII